MNLSKGPTEAIQIDFGGPIINEKTQGMYFLSCNDRFSKYPTAEVLFNAIANNVHQV